MLEILIVVMIVTSLWVVLDAHRLGGNAVGWAIGCLFVWIVALPAYVASARPKLVAARAAGKPSLWTEHPVTD